MDEASPGGPEAPLKGPPDEEAQARKRKTLPGKATMAWAQVLVQQRQDAKRKRNQHRPGYKTSSGKPVRALVFVTTVVLLCAVGFCVRFLVVRYLPQEPHQKQVDLKK